MKNNSEDINESHLIAYINGELSAGEKQLVERWIASSALHKKTFEELEKTWILTGKIAPKPVVVNTEEAWLKLRQKITSPEKKANKGRILTMKRWLPLAAAAAIVAGIFGIYKYLNPAVHQITLSAKNEIVIDTLQDGSVISLNKNATLTYPDQFAQNERRISLRGEAFFEIEPDQTKPFIIELSHAAQVTVLGTSFNIEESDSTTEVFVKTGKVEFRAENAVTILLPGEKGILHYATGEIKKTSSDTPDYEETYWLDQKLVFNKTPLKEVVAVLNTIFEKQIVLENVETGNCTLTTEFERESLEHILQVIADSFALEIEKTTGGYILKGNGC